MHVIAFVISLVTGLLSFLQGGCATVAGSVGSSISKGVGGVGVHEEFMGTHPDQAVCG